jgi:hypothetical protein
MLLATSANAQPACVAPPISNQEVKNLIDRERNSRTDLPAPFPDFRWTVHRDGCYYVYIEYGIPERLHYDRIFKLNQYGVIVDIPDSGLSSNSNPLKCPAKVFTERQLAEIVRKQRATRKDLPAAPTRFRTQIDRLRCLYLYFEFPLPESKGGYTVFTIDPYGELMEAYRTPRR